MGLLRPLLFVIYINDLPEVVKSSAYLFAILHQVLSPEDDLARHKDIDALAEWSEQIPCSYLALNKRYPKTSKFVQQSWYLAYANSNTQKDLKKEA